MKKGFTLIEIMVTMALLSIITATSLICLKGFKELKEKTDMDHAVNSVVEFINAAKSFSRNNNCSTNINISGNKDELELYSNIEKIKFCKLPRGIKITRVTSDGDDIKINNVGKAINACTLTLNNDGSLTREITIKVGTGYVSEKK
ncbi:hypothetical protein SDC9_112967 [bioreactor metagenome]|uniref:General secretion pathway GspH domain-containing protein n=1 Tax=bioreactor metagenome TaxID=1076179 RepID=A0A645BLK4_9ZZZZ